MLRAMSPRNACLTLLALAAWCAGCAAQPASDFPPEPAPSFRERAGSYVAARGLDFADFLSLRIGVGPGLLAGARITEFVAIGAGSLGPPLPWSAGFKVEVHFLGWNRREGGVWTERRGEVGLSTLYYCEAEGDVLSGNRERFGADAREPMDIGAELYFALLGAAVDVRLSDFPDFLAGIFGFDPDGDDPR
jgi:hypothetical protein